MATVDLSRVTVATAIDDRVPYNDEAVLLFSSLERFGGAVRAAQRRAYFIDDVSADTERRLRDVGVEVLVREAIDPRFRFANKLRMFDPTEHEDTELLVALDCDVVVAGDFSEHLVPGLLQAKQVDGDGLTVELWERLFAHFGVALPSERYPTSLVRGWTHAYFNTGVIIVPDTLLGDLATSWQRFIEAIVEDTSTFGAFAEWMSGKIPEHHRETTPPDLHDMLFAEQWAFSLAVAELAAPYAVLPLEMNFPPPYLDAQRPGDYIQPRFHPHAARPLLVHHHHFCVGGLRETGYRLPDDVIRQVDDALLDRSAATGLCGAEEADPRSAV